MFRKEAFDSIVVIVIFVVAKKLENLLEAFSVLPLTLQYPQLKLVSFSLFNVSLIAPGDQHYQKR